MQIYLAGSLFSDAERNYAKKVVDKLESKGQSVFWPWRDTGDRELKRLYRGDMSKVSDEIVRRNLSAIKRSDIVIAIADGPDVETGTSMEIGYAHAIGKKVLGLRTDFRNQGRDIGAVNIMITRSMDALFQSEKGLFDYLRGLKRKPVTKKGLKDFYSSVSQEYSDPSLHPVTNYLRLAEQSFTRGLLSGKTFDTALDIGCGTGGFLENVKSKNKIGVDLSEKMMAEYKKRLPEATYLVADVEKKIPVPSGSVDIVHSSFLIDHINNLNKFFSEVSRVLKKRDDLFLLSLYNKKIMVNYRKNSKTFDFKAADGSEYSVYSNIPNYIVLKESFVRYFNLHSKETISVEYGGKEIGIDYLVLGARK